MTLVGQVDPARQQRAPLSVLIEAYDCSPLRQHAAGASWRIVERLAKTASVSVITEGSQYREEIEGVMERHELRDRLRFFYVDRKPGRRKRVRPAFPIREVFDYRSWLHDSFSVAVDVCRASNIDLVHHLRGNSFRLPGNLWKLGLPFVWGPTGGTGGVDWGFMGTLGWRSRAAHVLRRVVSAAQLQFSPSVRSACRAADVLIAQSAEDARRMSRLTKRPPVVLHEQATDPTQYVARRGAGIGVPVRLAWVGRCIELKGMPLLIRALARTNLRGRLVVEVGGDGPARRVWQQEAQKLGVDWAFVWRGWLDRSGVSELLARADALAFTSLWEGTPATVMEALSCGLPVIGMNKGGFGDVISEVCGFRIGARTHGEAVRGWEKVLREICDKPQLLESLSIGAGAVAREHSWDLLAERIEAQYWEALRLRGKGGG